MTRRRFSAKKLTERLLDYDGKCAACGGKFGGSHGKPEWDHLIPLEMGGEDEIENLQPLHAGCHRDKTKNDIKHIAKSKRMKQRDLGISRQSKRSFETNRNGRLKAKIGGGVEER